MSFAVCQLCLRFRQEPLSGDDLQEARAKHYRPLYSCTAGRYELQEPGNIRARVRLSSPAECPSFSGGKILDHGAQKQKPVDRATKERAVGAKRRLGYCNARDCLPPDLYAEVRKCVGPGMFYIPSVRRRNPLALADMIRQTFAKTASVSRTAKELRCSRNTVRKVVGAREPAPMAVKEGENGLKGVGTPRPAENHGSPPPAKGQAAALSDCAREERAHAEQSEETEANLSA
jgi:hypothetical protein